MKSMGINSRILLMLILTGLIFFLLAISLYLITNNQEKLMLSASQKQFDNADKSIIKLKTSTIKQVVYDYTYWNDFADNLKKNDTAWYYSNITSILKTYRIEYACVFDSNFNIVHEVNSNNFHSCNFITSNTLKALKNSRLLNYFLVVPDGLLEISCASVHYETDPTHKLTKPNGYLFLGKCWNEEYLNELKTLTGAEISLINPSETITPETPYSILTSQDLMGWDGKNVVKIVFTRNSNSIEKFHRITEYMIFIILCSILTTWIIYYFTTRKWITKPLFLVKHILEKEHLPHINELRQYQGEFKQIGDLFLEFINQKEELKLAKVHAEESDRLKSAFLANMSHEIRTPMNGILGFADLLKEPNLTGEQQLEYIRIIEKSGMRMLNIINDIIDISKIEAGLVTITNSMTNINDQIEYIYTFFKNEVESKGIKFSRKASLHSSEARVITDREKVYAILMNLVKNALKYTNEGTIEFGYVFRQEGYLEFYVRDTGVGIPKNRQKAIFERFIQADTSDFYTQQGAGLGLAITKAYVDMLGGKIWVESEAGKGSTFYFTLPYTEFHEDNQEDKKLPTSEVDENKLVRLKMLIAEDDEDSARFLNIAMKKFCRDILFVNNGIDAIRTCRENPDIDLVLMDVQMPQIDGYEATRQIRQFNKKVIIIAQTAYGLYVDREKAINAGCNDYISKPININQLVGMIQKHFTI